jgi:two-component system cell cycle sensor histidine kinase/response regulator CckA
VVTGTSSTEALERFRSAPDEFNLVITDQTMPQITGDEPAKELMKLRPEIPIILCTVFSERISASFYFGYQLLAYQSPPFSQY